LIDHPTFPAPNSGLTRSSPRVFFEFADEVCTIGIVLAVAALWLGAVLSVKLVHRVKPRTQAARTDDDGDVVHSCSLHDALSWFL